MEQLHASSLDYIQSLEALTSVQSLTAVQACQGGQIWVFHFYFKVPLLWWSIKRKRF